MILEYLVLRITGTLRTFLVSQLNNVQKVKLKQKAKLWNEVQMIKIHIFDDLWAEKMRDNPKSKSTVSRWCWSWSRKEGDGGGGLAEQQLGPGRCAGDGLG